MCGYAVAYLMRKDKQQKATIGLGYYGGSLNIDDHGISDDSAEGREDMRAFLMKHTKKELIDMIEQFVDNADEG